MLYCKSWYCFCYISIQVINLCFPVLGRLEVQGDPFCLRGRLGYMPYFVMLYDSLVA